ncbi:MAG: penicillin-binding transpeptidase domain-containing protein, partial [Nannocystaceae bacterium]
RAKGRARSRGDKVTKTGQVGPVIIRGPFAPEGSPRRGFAATLGDRDIFVEVPEGGRYAEPSVGLSTQFPEGGITVARITRQPKGLSLPEGWLYGRIASGPEAVVLVSDIRDGAILAMVSGYQETRGGFNRAVDARRQPGSTFKPFVYGAAVESEKFTAASLVIDSPEIYEKWRPTNFERDRYRGEIRLREALTHSVNTIAIKLLDGVGIGAGADFARRAGIESPLAENLSLALGTSEVTPFELLRAYTTLARGGVRRELEVIRSVEIEGGDVSPEASSPTPVIAPEVAFIVNSMMSSVVREGTGRRAKKLGFWVAGKTGTAAENRDAWFAGFSRDFAAV